ncbi:carbohydrate sulfotransferase 5-like [Penaeus indicus]|uniref:carbohydrate sulfotransferase 5-like n=1 Tax=Penaeus indicus TaxID=29960 RepID=UPI00300C16EC
MGQAPVWRLVMRDPRKPRIYIQMEARLPDQKNKVRQALECFPPEQVRHKGHRAQNDLLTRRSLPCPASSALGGGGRGRSLRTTKIMTMINRKKVILQMVVLAIVVPFGLLYGIKHIDFAPSSEYQVADTRSFDESRGKTGITLEPRGNTTSPRGIFATFSKTRDDPRVKSTDIFGETDPFREETQGTPAKGLKILLLSSVGRSGSSLFGELLAQMPKTLYFFEPLMFFQKRTAEGVQPRSTLPLLQKVYGCAWGPEDARWASFGASRSLARQNGRQPVCVLESGERVLDCLRNTCLQNTNIVVKVIRMRVAWLSSLLSEGDSSVRVVHLVRDPRGAFLSLQRQGMKQKNPREWCPAILQDVKLVNETKHRFPDSFTSIKYEDFCRDPKGVAASLWKFISGDAQASLPQSWLNYLKVHTDPAQSRPWKRFGTLRNTQRQTQAWRRKISGTFLREVETACGEVIDALGHRRFPSLREVRNFSIPLMR